jgi:hypothetical protein
MNFTNLNAKDVLEETRIKEYELGMNFFHSELVELNVILYLAEEIVHFPFDLFVYRDNTLFFSTVMRSFYESAVLLITKVATDQKGDLFTLLQFKNKIRDWVKPELKKEFDAHLKNLRFDAEVKNLLEKARGLRNHRIAHTTQEFISGGVTLYRPDIYELKKLRDELNSLLDALSFNVEYSKLPLQYDSRVIHPKGSNYKTDIEEILHSIVKDSNLLSLPEENPERWERRKSRLTVEELETINRYRRKFNLEAV